MRVVPRAMGRHSGGHTASAVLAAIEPLESSIHSPHVGSPNSPGPLLPEPAHLVVHRGRRHAVDRASLLDRHIGGEIPLDLLPALLSRHVLPSGYRPLPVGCHSWDVCDGYRAAAVDALLLVPPRMFRRQPESKEVWPRILRTKWMTRGYT